ETKALGVLDHHDGGGRHVDADLDYGGRNQESDLVAGELSHHAVLFRALHLAVNEPDTVAETLLQTQETFRRIGEVLGALGLGFLDQRTDPVDQLAGVKRAADAVRDLVEAAHRYRAGFNR